MSCLLRVDLEDCFFCHDKRIVLKIRKIEIPLVHSLGYLLWGLEMVSLLSAIKTLSSVKEQKLMRLTVLRKMTEVSLSLFQLAISLMLVPLMECPRLRFFPAWVLVFPGRHSLWKFVLLGGIKQKLYHTFAACLII